MGMQGDDRKVGGEVEMWRIECDGLTARVKAHHTNPGPGCMRFMTVIEDIMCNATYLYRQPEAVRWTCCLLSESLTRLRAHSRRDFSKYPRCDR